MFGRWSVLFALLALFPVGCDTGDVTPAEPIEDVSPPLPDRGPLDRGPDPDFGPDAAPDSAVADATPDGSNPADAAVDAAPVADAAPMADGAPDPDAGPMPDAGPTPDAGPECAAAGESIPVIPDAPECCPGLAPIGCDAPDDDGMCPGGCEGAVICAACGDGTCGAGENRCNCPDDCATGCTTTADCVDQNAPIRCLGQWRCDPDEAHPADNRGDDGCAYQCLFNAPACDDDGDCEGDDVCRDCPNEGNCDDNARICSDPANVEAD